MSSQYLEHVEAELGRSRAHADNLAAILAERDVQITQLRQSLQTANSLVDARTAEIVDLKQQNKALELRVDVEKATGAGLARDLLDTQKKLAEREAHDFSVGETYANALSKIAQLEAKLAEVQKDAERYLFLRTVDPDAEDPTVMLHVQNDWGNWSYLHLGEDELDTAIDAARNQQAGG